VAYAMLCTASDAAPPATKDKATPATPTAIPSTRNGKKFIKLTIVGDNPTTGQVTAVRELKKERKATKSFTKGAQLVIVANCKYLVG
jgi:hypothetical protein